MSSARPIVTLTTDFGTGSSYVAQVKGVLLTRNPEVCLVDLSHAIGPQDIRGGALLLADAYPCFPPGTLHVAVIDPGVGTGRRIVYAEIGHQKFLAPDNGLLTLVAARTPPTLLIDVSNAAYFLPVVHPTFHGRDIFAPVAGHLSLGLPPRQLGPQIGEWTRLLLPDPVVAERTIAGQILHIDPFGNLVTNITADELARLPATAVVVVSCRSAVISRIHSTYGEVAGGSLIALIGSCSRLEIAVVNGNAAETLGARIDDPVEVQWSCES